MPRKKNICEIIRRKAVTSLLYEVSASPKPGLVDRFNPGAHGDMDFFSFMASSAALSPYFYHCAATGAIFHGKDLRDLLSILRPGGLEAEKVMYSVTGGANTHKGLIFSMGILCAAAALYLINKAEGSDAGVTAGEKIDTGCQIPGKTLATGANGIRDAAITDGICDITASMTRGICAEELESLTDKPGLTHGEKTYLKYGSKGIRGEAEKGFPTVRKCSLPLLSRLTNGNRYPDNDALVQTLLNLMAVNEDTNILARHDYATLDYVREHAFLALEAGGMYTPRGRKTVYSMDKDFISKNISPGGSADLLAITVMLYLLSKIQSYTEAVYRFS